MHNRIGKLFIANRGEIARRIQRTARRMGIRCVAGFSEFDAASSAVNYFDEVTLIGPTAAGASYLNPGAVLDGALRTGCNALHPGYGFLSENADFAAAVIEHGLIWVGPSPEAIRAIGTKTGGRSTALQAKVPVLPGTGGDLSDTELLDAADRIGYPVIVKAVGGGGGRGMRVAHSRAELATLITPARSEAQRFFNDGRVFLERYVPSPRHVEVQVFGDHFGSVIHLGTRDCSAQRRHQKLLEEAPAPNLSPALRESIEKAAVRAARRVGYENAGTAEFLVEGKNFYFLEMNTRLQVEHPVTEAVTGLDLVELQLRVAQGERLPHKQSAIKTRGHAIEFRINAEDPANRFAPTRGRLERWSMPEDPALRVDVGYDEGDELALHYDGMIAKVIISGSNRADVLRRAEKLFRRMDIGGIQTNLPFHRWIVRSKRFFEAPCDIGFVERVFSAECLEELGRSDLRDDALISSVDGFASLERLIFSEVGKAPARHVELRHQSSGYFIAVPLSDQGKPRPKSEWRASSSRDHALAMLRDEVFIKPKRDSQEGATRTAAKARRR